MSDYDYTWRNRSWTEARVEILKHMWADGSTVDAIASALHRNCTSQAVWGKARSLGLPDRDDGTSKFWNKARIDSLAKLWDKGHSASVIAEDLGCTRNAIIGKAHRLRLPKRGDESKRVESRRTNRGRGRQTSFNRMPAAQRYGQGAAAHIAPQAAKRLDPLPMPAPEAPTPSAVKFEALEANHCRWPYGEGKDRLFCGCNATPGTSWCPSHRVRVFMPAAAQLVRRRHIPERQKTYEEIEKEMA